MVVPYHTYQSKNIVEGHLPKKRDANTSHTRAPSTNPFSLLLVPYHYSKWQQPKQQVIVIARCSGKSLSLPTVLHLTSSSYPTMRFYIFCTVAVVLCHLQASLGYVTPEIKQRWNQPDFTMESSLAKIDEAVKKGDDIEDLFAAVKYIDRFANQMYPTLDDRQKLMDKINGSWELRLALNSDRDINFYPHPEFRAFAMAFSAISNDYFGKGIAPDSTFCFVALGGPSTRNIMRRQVFMNYEDYFINGRQVPGWDLSYYLRGYTKDWGTEKKQVLAFTVIACTDTSLAVRGSKTGGIAIFRRIQDDMAPAAFGFTLD